jgi:uncharacterized protein YktA (UPF0223 family)
LAKKAAQDFFGAVSKVFDRVKTVVRLKRSYENTGSVVCLMAKWRKLERNFEELKPASHVSYC